VSAPTEQHHGDDLSAKAQVRRERVLAANGGRELPVVPALSYRRDTPHLRVHRDAARFTGRTDAPDKHEPSLASALAS
jgi:hypothetical protein